MIPRRRSGGVVPPLLAVGMLVAVGALQLAHPDASDAEPFHARVRASAEVHPMRIGEWVGAELPVQPAAFRLLKPNVLVSRAYYDASRDRLAAFLLVQSRDARDLAGHYPPNCYPALGWSQDFSVEKDWELEDGSIPGMRYGFSYTDADGQLVRAVVANFMVLPDGGLARDMTEVRGAAADYRRHRYGAAQIQILVDGEATEAEQDEIVRELLAGSRPLIAALGSGLQPRRATDSTPAWWVSMLNR